LKRVVRWALLGVAASFVLLALGYVIMGRPPMDLDESNLPRFVTHDFIQLERIHFVSKFRSGVGHDHSDAMESCRSMKHYYSPSETLSGSVVFEPPGTRPESRIEIISPVTGKIVGVEADGSGRGSQVILEPATHPSYQVRLFHIYPVENVSSGTRVGAGETLGFLGRNQSTDVSVETLTLHGRRYVSYFSVMDEGTFDSYRERGLTDRTDVILSRQARDEHPLRCEDGRFVGHDDLDDDDWVRLSDP
jgi:hypothetical protein